MRICLKNPSLNIIFRKIILVFAWQLLLQSSCSEFCLPYLSISFLFLVHSSIKIIVQMQLSHNKRSVEFKQPSSIEESAQHRLYSTQPSSISSKTAMQNLNTGNRLQLQREIKKVINRCQNCLKLQSKLIMQKRMLQQTIDSVQQKERENEKLKSQIESLKNQEEYLMKSIEELMGKNINKDEIVKVQRIIKSKQDELNFANKEIEKLRAWLKQEKSEVYRSLECIKMKDIVIQGLEKQLQDIKEAKMLKRSKKIEYIKLSPEDELKKYKNKSKQLEQQVYRLTEQIDNLRNDNFMIKCRLQKDKQQSQMVTQILNPIQRIKRDSKRKISGNEFRELKQQNSNQIQIRKLLSTKILFLQHQIEVLLSRQSKRYHDKELQYREH